MQFKDFINCLQARKETLTESLQFRENRKQDFSSWRFNSKEELEGRLSEVKNTLDMLKVHLKGQEIAG